MYTERVPLGVVGVITSWNFPVAIPLWKLALCLAFGNTGVFKPAELTPLTAHLIVEVFIEAGLPPGVLKLVYGPGSVVGEAIARHPKVNAVTFTGSNAIGRHLYQIASERGAKVQLELGGKTPVIAVENADLDFAVELTTSGACRSTGQKCAQTGTGSRAVERYAHGVRRLHNAVHVSSGSRYPARAARARRRHDPLRLVWGEFGRGTSRPGDWATDARAPGRLGLRPGARCLAAEPLQPCAPSPRYCAPQWRGSGQPRRPQIVYDAETGQQRGEQQPISGTIPERLLVRLACPRCARLPVVRVEPFGIAYPPEIADEILDRYLAQGLTREQALARTERNPLTAEPWYAMLPTI